MSDKKLTVSVGMFRAIHTKYIGPSNRRGSRIKAFDDSGNSVTISYDNAYNRDESYAEACRNLCEKMGWTGRLVGGGTKGGYTFVFVEEVNKGLLSACEIAQATISRLDKRGSAKGTQDVIFAAISNATEAMGGRKV